MGTSTPVSMMVVHTSTSISLVDAAAAMTVGELLLAHLAVGRRRRCASGTSCLDPGGARARWTPRGCAGSRPARPGAAPGGWRRQHDPVVVLQHIGLHGVAVLRRLLDDAHVPDARHGHVQRAGNGRGRERQHVHAVAQLLDLLLVGHAEALLLVDDQQAQILELHVLLQQPVGADDNVHLALSAAPRRVFFCCLGGAEAGEQLHRRPGSPPSAARTCLIVLPGQDGGGHQNGAPACRPART